MTNAPLIAAGHAAPLDVAAIRQDFPILRQQVHGRPLVYLDNASTTQKPQPVTDRVTRFYGEENANVHRGVHWLSERATEAYEEARATVARFLHAGEAREIVFVRGTTEAINLVEGLRVIEQQMLAGVSKEPHRGRWVESNRVTCRDTIVVLDLVCIAVVGGVEQEQADTGEPFESIYPIAIESDVKGVPVAADGHGEDRIPDGGHECARS